jgi:hypothetical protein
MFQQYRILVFFRDPLRIEIQTALQSPVTAGGIECFASTNYRLHQIKHNYHLGRRLSAYLNICELVVALLPTFSF